MTGVGMHEEKEEKDAAEEFDDQMNRAATKGVLNRKSTFMRSSGNNLSLLAKTTASEANISAAKTNRPISPSRKSEVQPKPPAAMSQPPLTKITSLGLPGSSN